MEKIINIIENAGIKDCVISERNCLKYFEESNLNIKFIDDGRSAAFWAFGKSYRENKTVVQIINGEYIPNIYTAITEAWFQKTNVLIIAYYDSYNSVNCDYLNRCLIKNITKSANEVTKEDIALLCSTKGPALLNVAGVKINEDKKSYDKALDLLSEVVKDNMPVFCYEPEVSNSNYKLDLKYINSNHKYGIFSKYMGYITAIEKKAVLCCSADCILLDLNIFNNRYINENFKVILFDYDNTICNNNIDKWISSNNIDCRILNDIDRDSIEKMYSSKCPSMIIVRKEIN